jgi:hypothetical protein
MKNDDWGFSDEETQELFDTKAYDESLKRYVAPIKKHDCDRVCNVQFPHIGNNHEYQEVWDDFQLSQQQREEIFMEVVRTRGREGREATLIRQFVSTLDGSYIIRLESTTSLTKQRFGEARFETREECVAYYNYCIQLFEFSKGLLVPDEDWEGEGFFADLDALEGGFFDDLDDTQGSFFDDLEDIGDSEGESGWDTEDDEHLDWE